MTTNEKASSVRGTLYDVKGTCLICGTELNSKVTSIGTYLVCKSTGFVQRCYEVKE